MNRYGLLIQCYNFRKLSYQLCVPSKCKSYIVEHTENTADK